jgi:hypothetical protein
MTILPLPVVVALTDCLVFSACMNPDAVLLVQIFEIELLRWESVNDLSPEKDGSLMKQTLEEGDLNVWDKPKEADLVTVSYTACVNGEKDPFADVQGHEFCLADGHFCPAIKAAVLTMKKGERVALQVGSSQTQRRCPGTCLLSCKCLVQHCNSASRPSSLSPDARESSSSPLWPLIP